MIPSNRSPSVRILNRGVIELAHRLQFRSSSFGVGDNGTVQIALQGSPRGMLIRKRAWNSNDYGVCFEMDKMVGKSIAECPEYPEVEMHFTGFI